MGNQIVNGAIADNVNGDQPVAALPQKSSLIRAANRQREQTHHKHPSDLSFQMNDEALPEDIFYYCRYIGGKKNRRHLMFATQQQLQLLPRAKSWYIQTGTSPLYPAVYHPQVPLAFVILSGKQTSDYRAILTVLNHPR